jgi:hypothetical protein
VIHEVHSRDTCDTCPSVCGSITLRRWVLARVGPRVRTHLIHHVPAWRLALVDAAVLGPWNTPFTEHMQRHADVYRTMPPHVFDDIITPRLRTATHHPMSDASQQAYHTPWAGPEGQQRWINQVEAVSFEDTPGCRRATRPDLDPDASAMGRTGRVARASHRQPPRRSHSGRTP